MIGRLNAIRVVGIAAALAALAFAASSYPASTADSSTLPAAPAGLSAAAADQSITLTWDDPSDDSITRYEYRARANLADFSWTDWTTVLGSDASTTDLALNGLANGIEYRLMVRAVNPNGPGPSAPAADPGYLAATPRPPTPASVGVTPNEASAASTEVPAAPTGLTATAGDATITLSWNDPSDSTITHYEYNVNHNDTSTGNLSGWSEWMTIPGSDSSTTSYAIAGLANGTRIPLPPPRRQRERPRRRRPQRRTLVRRRVPPGPEAETRPHARTHSPSHAHAHP